MIRKLLVAFVLVFVSAFLPAARSNAAATFSATTVSQGSDAADLLDYQTPSVSTASDRLLLLYVTAGRTDGTAAVPSAVTGLGASWSQVQTTKVASGNLTSSIFSATNATGADVIHVVFPSAQQNMTWQLVDAGTSTNTVKQTVAGTSTKTAITASLPNTVGAQSLTMGFYAGNSSSQTITPGSGYSQLGQQTSNTLPSLRTAAEWRADAQQTVDFATSGTVQKTIIAVEIMPADVVIEPTSGKTVAIIGDSLTYQNGNGTYELTQKLVAAGYDPSNIYIWGVGGKKLTTADTSGKTTMQNIADARVQLQHVDTWIIALGTNNAGNTDAAFTQGVNTVLDTIGSQERVVWISMAFYKITNNNAARFNPILSATVEARVNGDFVDWNTYIHNGRDETGLWVYPVDYTHMTTAGYDIRNNYYVAQLQ